MIMNSLPTDAQTSTAAALSAPRRSHATDSRPMATSEPVLVTIATYNELDNLPELVQRLLSILPTADVLVVDDSSPDGTGEWVARQATADPRIKAIHRPRKMGLGSATMASLRYAVNHNYTYVVALDADGSHDPKYIPSMLEAIRGNAGDEPDIVPDIVIGSRYVPGGRTLGWPWHRRMMSRAVNYFARTVLGLPVRDCSGAFRCTRVDLLKKVDLESFRSQGYAVFEESLWRFKAAAARFQEIPIVFANRTRGRSKISLRESIAAISMLIRLGLRNCLRLH